MSWQSLAPLKSRKTRNVTTIAVRSDSLIIRFGPDTLSRLGWETGLRMDVQIGTGDDYGVIRLVRSRDGFSLMRSHSNAAREGAHIRISKGLIEKSNWPDVPERFEPTPIKIEMRDGAAEFALPWVQRQPSFASENIVPHRRDGGAIKINRQATHVATANVLGGN